MLNTCGTHWKLFLHGSSFEATERIDISLAQQIAAFLKGKPVIEAGLLNVAGTQLFVLFKGGYLFVVTPSETDDEHDGVPYWELFLPGHQMVEVGPKSKLSFRRSDQPAA
jgi:hypothetical protein